MEARRDSGIGEMARWAGSALVNGHAELGGAAGPPRLGAGRDRDRTDLTRTDATPPVRIGGPRRPMRRKGRRPPTRANAGRSLDGPAARTEGRSPLGTGPRLGPRSQTCAPTGWLTAAVVVARRECQNPSPTSSNRTAAPAKATMAA